MARKQLTDDTDLTIAVVLTGLAIADVIRDALVARGVHELRFSQLFVFARLDKGPATISDIASEMGCSHQAASARVNELENAGLVRRIRNPVDGRSRLVELTRKGRAALQIGIDARDELVDQLGRSTTPAQRAAAHTVIQQLLDIASGSGPVRVRDLGFPRRP